MSDNSALRKKFIHYIVPSIVSQMVFMLYTLVDLSLIHI